MGILFDASSDKLDFGDVAVFDGLTALTVSLWAKIDNIGNTSVGRRWVSKWHSTGAAGTCSFIICQTDNAGGNLSVGVATAQAFSTGFSIWHTTSAVLTADSTWRHYLWSWATPDSFLLNRDSVSQGLTADVTNSPASIGNSTTALTYGQGGGGDNGLLGSLAEVAIWNRVLTSAERTTLATGYSPDFVLSGRLLYTPLRGDTVDRHGLTPTATSLTFTDHPPIVYPGSSFDLSHLFAPLLTTWTRHPRAFGDRLSPYRVTSGGPRPAAPAADVAAMDDVTWRGSWRGMFRGM